MKYAVLVNILDQIRNEAPQELKTYHPKAEEHERIDYARSRAYIHLFLKVKFGLLDFGEREKLITDAKSDGGIDAYLIDQESRTIYLVQAKFRTNEKNFEEKQIDLREILQIDADRITQGQEVNESGTPYNENIKKMAPEIIQN